LVRVRMGLRTGEPPGAETEYVGIDVHPTARIGTKGYGGQILPSDASHDLVANDLPEGVSLRDLGDFGGAPFSISFPCFDRRPSLGWTVW
jgi:hypothetical protein